MKNHTPGPSPSRRAAHVRPRALCAAAFLAASVFTGGAVSQSAPSPKETVTAKRVKAANTALASSADIKALGSYKPRSLRDLPELVREYGRRRANQASAGKSVAKSVTAKATVNSKVPGGGTIAGVPVSENLGFALTEGDLTRGNISDERQPAMSPGGDFILFISNGIDSNKDGTLDANVTTGHYHVWIMNRNGTEQRQLTGLTTAGASRDDNLDQTRPAWSPDGNQIVYLQQGTVVGGGTAPQLYVLQPFVDANSSVAGIQPSFEQRTFFAGNKLSPSWSPNGQLIAFASDAGLAAINDMSPVTTDTNGDYDIFTINPSGNAGTITRLTGGAVDSGNGQIADDINPAWGLGANQNTVFFASNRTDTSVLPTGRRIWHVRSNGLGQRVLTDPTKRPGGAVTDVDDYPSPNVPTSGSTSNLVTFQSNSPTDLSDASGTGARDFNVWSLSNVPIPVAAATPTPTPVPKLLVNSFNNSRVVEFDPATGTPRGVVASGFPISHPEGIAMIPDRTGDGVNDYLISNRDNAAGSIDLLDGSTGERLGSLVPPTASGGLTNPTGLVVSGNYVYVCSGTTDDQTTTNAIHRFNLSDGSPAGTATNSSVFSNFASGVTSPITGGLEGITIGPGIGGGTNLYVSAFGNDLVAAFDLPSGLYRQVYVATGDGGLDGPTGLTFGPDGNLYVSSSNTDDVKRYQPPTVSLSPATYLGDFVADNNGTVTGLDAPEGLAFGPDLNADGNRDLIVSSFGQSGTPGLGTRLNAYDGVTGAQLPGAGQPYAQSSNLSGPSYFVFNSTALVVGTPTPTPTPSPAATTPVETVGNLAELETNPLSSPDRATAAGLAQDKSADREPGYARSGVSAQAATQIIFASQRRTAAAPGNNPSDPSPVVVNPGGGDQNIGGPDTPPTHDIWITTTRDFTPPVLLPQSLGNQIYPVLAPGPQSPVPLGLAGRGEAGITPGSQMYVACVIEDKDSGLLPNSPTSSVFVTFRDANDTSASRFVRQMYYDEDDKKYEDVRVNEDIPVRVLRETSPIVAPGYSNLPLRVYDDGPLPGGHERQAGAIKGDGVYYCENTFTAPSTVSDFYMDISVYDNDFNFFVYDNIWGFTTTSFAKTVGNDLFVSDYTVGQKFPIVSTPSDLRFNNMDPVESYYLYNPGGDILDPATELPDPKATHRVAKTTMNNVDVWRTLCRGDVPELVLNQYAPRPEQQYDPADFENGLPATLPDKTRTVSVANSAVLWAAPYAATLFTGPGTIFDAEVQRRLTTFLQNGGRLFLTGREIAYALSNNGTQTNNFLENEIHAKFVGENLRTPSENVLQPEAGKFTVYDKALTDKSFTNAAYDILQFPPRSGDSTDKTKQQNTYADAAFNQDFHTPFSGGFADGFTGDPRYGGGTNGIDKITPVGGGAGTGVTITPSYSLDGATVAQRVVAQRGSGVESRVAFLGFGLEGVNRRYSKDAAVKDNPPFCVNVRASVQQNVRNFLKTTGVRGRVINNSTNQPVPNFLVEVISEGGAYRYFALTDSAGAYQINGIPADSGFAVTNPDGSGIGFGYRYFARPARTTKDVGINPGFIKSDGVEFIIASTNTHTGIDIRVIPSPAGTIAGTAAQSNGTPDDLSDDTVLPNVPVLIVSNESSTVFPNGGRYAQLSTTDAGGRFNFPNVPSNDTSNGQSKITYRIIFNPTIEDIPETSGLRATYSGQNPNFRRREIPDARRPAPLIVPVGGTFVVNDPTPGDASKADDATDSGIKIVIPVGPSIIGRVLLNGTLVGGASIELLDAGGNSLTPPRTTTSVAAPDTLGNNYSLFDVPPGSYLVKATLSIAGYPNPLTATVSVTVGSAVVTAPDVQAPDLRLEKQDITGIVRYNNVPLQGAVVTLLAPDGTTVIGKPPLLTDNPVTTGADGSYTFLRVDPGSYIIRAVAPNGVSKDVPITIVAGQDLALNIDLYASNVSGTVTLNGSPLGGATVELIQNGQTVKSTTTASDGTYTFTLVAPGVYTVRASSNGDSADFVLTVSPGVDRTGINLDLFLQSISGTITLNGSPIKGALVELISNGQVIQSVVSADDGTYKFDRVAAGVFTVRASYLEDSVSIDVTVNRGAGGDRTGIDIELKLQTISGRVLLNRLDGKGPQPIGSAGIQLYRGAKLMNATTSAANGTYRFINVGPGTYTVRGGRFGDTASVTVVVTRGKDVVAPDIILFLQNVTGIITQNGKPLKGAAVQFINSKGAGLARAATDANGRYTFVGVPSGNFTIRASYQGDSVERIVNVKRGQNLTAPTLDLKAQVIAGTVTVNGVRTANVIVELVQKANDRVIQRVKTDAKGSYIFNLVIVGTYTVRATYLGDTVSRDITVRRGVNGRMPVLALAAQTLSGSVTVDGRPASGVVAQLIRVEESGEVGQARTTSDARGNYTFGQVPAGRYLVRLTPPGIASRQVPVNVVRGVNTIVPLLNFASPAAPTPTPTATPNPANEEFQPTGQIYQISVPYTDSVEPNSTTTVAKAFNALPIDRNNVENYRISRYDARTQQYVGLSANSVIRRGEGYFLEPIARGVTIRRPATDATRKPTNVRTFTITLRNNASRPAAEQTNGFNLIGFPFDPARFDLAEWSAAEVVVPDGRRFRTVTEAAAAGILSQTLFTYDSDTGQYTPISDSMVPFRGYFARTFIDGVQVILHPSTTSTP